MINAISKIFRRKKEPTQVEQIESMFKNLEQKIDWRFTELKSQIDDLEIKLLTKDLKDKQQYGLLHYKMHESKKPETDEEKLKSSLKKVKLSDH